MIKQLLKGKNIIVGLSGSIAVSRMCDVVFDLKEMGANVYVVMSENATKFVSPLTFESLSNNRVSVDTFDRNFEYQFEHISISQKADIAIVAPATANIIGKIANGIADDMLSTTINACSCKKLIAPAMNDRMYNNPITQDNITKLKNHGYKFIGPEVGKLACGDLAIGILADRNVIIDMIVKELDIQQDLKNKNILVTAGPTIEAIDPVRYITNHSSGKMGYAIAESAFARGANVRLISGKTNLSINANIKKIDVLSAEEMYCAVNENISECDVLIMTAAVADYRPKEVSANKIKKQRSSLNIELVPNKDILESVIKNKRKNTFVCGFCMETENLIDRAKEKLRNKKLDMIVANNINDNQSGFCYDTNKAYIIINNQIIDLPLMKKTDLASKILDYIASEIM